ncbi:unnamed protein product [Cuscuta epithymum]|uniref:Uncharacterized protein n=1 Tax=Cuscuta epithymum TaxID=186058 RepID=A0AAV0D4H3_9ASTE|nr:unnamed protein product [Cuscuta epithymum]
MREMRASTAAGAAATVESPSAFNNPNNNTIWQWKSPIPYVFVSLSVAFTVILLAIIVLVCSLHKQNQSSDDGDDKSGRSTAGKSLQMITPSFIVVMAGDAKPSHIAIPIPSSPPHHQIEQL